MSTIETFASYEEHTHFHVFMYAQLKALLHVSLTIDNRDNCILHPLTRFIRKCTMQH